MTPPQGRCWANVEEVFVQLFQDNRLWFGKEGNGVPRRKTFLDESDGVSAWTWWNNVEVGHSQEAKQEVKEILGNEGTVFDTPKPSRLLERILQLATTPDSIVLDSFAGSGTTAHSVLKLNAQDGGQRRFVLVEVEDYADTITAERVRRVITGYGEGSKAVPGTGGGFDYCTLGAPLFLSEEQLNEAVGIAAIRAYVAYSEGIPEAERSATDNPHTPYLLGLNTETAWVFYYEPDRATALDIDFLASLRFSKEDGASKPGTAIIYADRCLLTQPFMAKHGIVFKKIPRDISRF